MKTIILKGLPDYMIKRLVPPAITASGIAYANIGTILFLPIEEGGTLVVFDVKSEWNYVTHAGPEELFGWMSGNELSAFTISEPNR